MVYKIRRKKQKEPKIIFEVLSDDKKWLHRHYSDGGETIERVRK
jgi:hypothetical protein